MSSQNKKRLTWLAVFGVPIALVLVAVWAFTAGPLAASAQSNTAQTAGQSKDTDSAAKKNSEEPSKDGGAGKAPAKQGGPPPALVRVADSDERKLQSRRDVIGRLREVKRTIVGTGQQGRVIVSNVEEGDAVVAHQSVLAQIDQTFVGISLEAANAEHEKAVAEHQRAESMVNKSRAELDEAVAIHEQLARDAENLKDLLSRSSAKKKEYDDAVSRVKAASARIDGARADIATAQSAVLIAAAAKSTTNADVQRVEEEVKRFTVRAPFDGVIVRKIMEVGQWVQKGAPVVELVSRGQIDAVVGVPEHIINNIRVGSDVEVTVDALQRTITGKVAKIIPLGESAARSFPVKVRMPDLDGQLMSGMSVTASIPTSEMKDHVTVPRDAVLRSAADTIVWAVIDNKAMRISINVLFAEGDRFAVESAKRNTGPPIKPGMQVIIEGGERLLFPGQAVRFPPEPAKK